MNKGLVRVINITPRHYYGRYPISTGQRLLRSESEHFHLLLATQNILYLIDSWLCHGPFKSIPVDDIASMN